ncbi:MAG TPA: hypothetical protein VFD69_19825 [Vicinamibacterales bacterium]|nr:hypothetical protein [Vicinamibacterales bacterium]
MRILLALKQRNYVNTFTRAVDVLLRRGHAVHLAWPDEDVSRPEELPDSSGLTIESWKPKRGDAWAPLATTMRRASDYLRYLEPAYRDAGKLRARAFEKVLHSLSHGERAPLPGWSDVALELSATERDRLKSITALMEDAIPSDPGTEARLAAHRPDAVLVSPLVDLGSSQTDIIKSARRLGIPTGMLLFSWDNLSTKGSLHVAPDRMFVWNELQRQEAATLHGFPVERTVATGAPRFDEFFALAPVTDRAGFFAPLGFDPRRPMLMYLGSSKFVITDRELPVIARWLAAIRGSRDPRLRDCNVLVRPHPDVKPDGDEGPVEAVRWHRLEGKGVVTRPFGDPRAVVLRTHYRKAQGFYEALHHSAAVVGLNTSASLEAAIVGRPVFTILAGDAADGQASTLHFRYLLESEGGCVSLASSFEEHRAQLAAALDEPGRAERLRAFAVSFLRPGGSTRPASDVLADAIESSYTSVRLHA